MRRGDIYFVQMPSRVGTNCEQGYRPVVIVSSNAGCNSCGAIMVCPITTQRKQLSCNVNIEWKTRDDITSQVLCNQITTLPVDLFADKEPVGHISAEEQKKISIAMLISLGIKTNYSEVMI